MLTTVDNPFNPYTQWDEWLAWDSRLGYHTPSYLARVVLSSDELSEEDQQSAIDDAINEIILNDYDNLYVRAVNPNE